MITQQACTASAVRPGNGVRDDAELRALDAAVRLASTDVPAEVLLGEVARRLRDCLAATRVSVLRLEDDHLVPTVSVATQEDEQLWVRYLSMPPVALPQDGPDLAAFRDGRVLVVPAAKRSRLVPAEWRRAFNLGSLVIAPMTAHGHLFGALTVDDPLDSPGYDDVQLRTLESVAAACATALAVGHARDDLRCRAEQAQLLVRLSEDLTLSPDARLAVERLAPFVRIATGAELLDLLLCDAHTARLFDASRPQGAVAERVRRWKRTEPEQEFVGGLLLVPLVTERTVVGVLRLRLRSGELQPAATRLLTVLAADLARVVAHAGLRARIAEGECELALADERARIAGELHHALGQLCVAALASIKPCLSGATGVAARQRLQLATQHIEAMHVRVQETVEALGLLQTKGRTLPATLREILHSYTRHLDVDWRTRGHRQPLSPSANSALAAFMVAATTTAARDPNTTTVVVRLNYHATELELAFRTDGVRQLRPATETATPMHNELRRAERRIAAAGGDLHVSTTHSGGLDLAVHMPLPADPERIPVPRGRPSTRTTTSAGRRSTSRRK